MEFTGNLAPGDILIIDSDKMTALLNGEDVRHLIKGEYLTVKPGHKFEYDDEEESRELNVTVYWKDRWL